MKIAVPAKVENLKGILLMVVGICLLSTMDAVAKLLVEANYSVIQILFIRGLVTMPFLLLWVLMRGGIARLRTRKIKAHIIRALFGFAAPMCFFLSLKNLPLADATVIFFVSPFIMTAASVPLFGEKVGIHRWGAIVVGFMGVLIVMQPTSGALQMDAFFVLGAAVCYCAFMLSGRWLGSTESTFAIVFYATAGLTLLAGIFTPFFWQPIPLDDLGLIGVMAALSLTANTLMVRSFTIAEVGVITPFEYTGLLWAVLLGFVIFSDLPALNVWIGVAVIGSSGLYMVYRENRRR
ncbi:MAG: DMT family transporter [Alphaproteobacteria bacterium]|nr:MAG: DMT family transporter [Alphaproteobacteria bacterium]